MGRKTMEEEEALNDFALKLVMKIMDSVTSHFTAMRTHVGSLQRLTHGEFTQETGLNHINELLKMWNHNSDCVHYTEFQGIKDLGDTFLYLYCAYWSMPTAQIPVPKVETSVDFTIKFNKSKPPEAPVDIYYKMDHQSLIQK
ncbi:A-kinase anchor protein 14 [Sorex fumeus]|uniref:A-kinase anchor protein 14 n=1 Tax=Sorex fumeus TaxID=62283 RepID=UPI0024ADA575|nr:A-kinase anchor protein 14 [Sorex fumeus]